MAHQHHAAHFVDFGFRRAGQRRVVHHRTHLPRADAAAIGGDAADHFTESQHAHQITVLHHHQRTDVQLGHGLQGFGQRMVGMHRVERIALDAQDVGDFHGEGRSATA
jgi:hypothetical protein